MHRASVPAAARALALALLLAACGDAAAPAGAGSVAPLDSGPPASRGAGAAPLEPEIPADAPLVAFLGDSLSAGLHLPKARAFPSALQRRLAAAGVPFRLVNAGVSGSTSAEGLRRLDWLLRQKPRVVVVQLGANDGFRAVPVEQVKENLSRIVAGVKAAGATPLLLGIRLPPNYGADYAARFARVYEEVAEEHDAALVPFFMEGVAGRPEMNLDDGIHPTAEGHERLAKNCEDALRRILR
jgi:acyl-CoA thioesterase-1